MLLDTQKPSEHETRTAEQYKNRNTDKMHQSIGVRYGTFPYNFSGQYINTRNRKHLNIWTLEAIQIRERIHSPAASNPPTHGPVPSHYPTKECDQTTTRNSRTSVPNLSRLINYTASRKPRSDSDIRMIHITLVTTTKLKNAFAR